MKEAWRKALRFAALPGAARVRFQRRAFVEDGTPPVQYVLRSETKTGEVIRDERDYALLKAVMTPLEKLAEHYDHEGLSIELDLENNCLTPPETG